VVKGFIIIILSYLLGSIPFGVLVSKYKGVDLQRSGSGNIGATNVLRTAGKGAAAITLIGDLLKGSFAIFLAKSLLQEPWVAISGIAVILGHILSVFLKFKGGKGVATAFGVILIYSPIVAVSAIFLWGIVVYIFRYSSLGAIATFLLLPGLMVVLEKERIKIFFALLMSIFILLRHTGNIKRLFKGTETKIGEKV
jgi:glycerol-3-phosphate acyltransferase PlsY